jgi:hypothetical protein
MAAAAFLEIASACNKMGNYHPILMQKGTQQTKKNMLSSKFIIPEV